ncbi:MAG: GNAT family N-acetyltransferase [Gammaproteobacteria bacterium]|nr:GNAT family N-acetyltransferase [Gammaproteobacteria bacterium]
MQTRIIGSLREITAANWDRLNGDDHPFVQHAFLLALEQHRCLKEYGWYPQHLLLEDHGKIIAAMPMYLKDNSYGEFIFDWSWALAYQRAGMPYYPKLVCSIPYTPATGPRLLIARDADYTRSARTLLSAATQHAQQLQTSSIHWLFTDPRDTDFFQSQQLPVRLSYQFQWENHGYTSFDHFLEDFSADKRKKIKRERRRVVEQDIHLEIRHGDEMTEELWSIYYQFYCDTFARKSGMPTLSLDFFKAVGDALPRQVVVVFALHSSKYVASAFNYRSATTLYGRHWGCAEEYHSLHFEACYYQGLDYCIANNLHRFEPGAQGEHKLSRGFLPTLTRSAHWIDQPQFRSAITQFVQREQHAVEAEVNLLLSEHSPFKSITSV